MPSVAAPDRHDPGSIRIAGLTVALGVVSLLIGTAVCVMIQGLFSPTHMRATAFWSAVASLMLLPVAATPTLLQVGMPRPLTGRVGPMCLAGLGFVPLALVGGVWGGGGATASLAPIALACLVGLSVAAFTAGYAAKTTRR
jgi:hypothetical protein